MANPSAFCKYPWSSTLQNTECEVVAQNVMKILKRTGNSWRELSWDEYREARLKDGNFNEWAEQRCFERVYPLVKTEELAKRFCRDWADASIA